MIHKPGSGFIGLDLMQDLQSVAEWNRTHDQNGDGIVPQSNRVLQNPHGESWGAGQHFGILRPQSSLQTQASAYQGPQVVNQSQQQSYQSQHMSYSGQQTSYRGQQTGSANQQIGSGYQQIAFQPQQTHAQVSRAIQPNRHYAQASQQTNQLQQARVQGQQASQHFRSGVPQLPPHMFLSSNQPGGSAHRQPQKPRQPLIRSGSGASSRASRPYSPMPASSSPKLPLSPINPQDHTVCQQEDPCDRLGTLEEYMDRENATPERYNQMTGEEKPVDKPHEMQVTVGSKGQQKPRFYPGTDIPIGPRSLDRKGRVPYKR